MKARHRWAIFLTAGVALAPLLASDNQPLALIFVFVVGAVIVALVIE